MKSWDTVPRRYRASYKPCPACGGAMAKHARQCQTCSVYIMRGERHYAWKGDAARDETKRERIQKRVSLVGVTCEACRAAPAVDRHHIDGDPGHNALYGLVEGERSFGGRAARTDELWADVAAHPDAYVIEDGVTWEWRPLGIVKRPTLCDPSGAAGSHETPEASS